jgi:fatty acid desaturase
MDRLRAALALVARRTVGAVLLQLAGLALLVGWGWATWGTSGALLVGAGVLLFLGFVVAQPGEPAPETPQVPDEGEVSWTF